jgi:hypothetical protein
MRILLFILMFIPALASAHGGQPSFEKEVNGYLVDIGYDQIGIRPGEEVAFDFDLFAEDGLAFAPFTAVEVHIWDPDNEVFHETIANDGVNVPTIKVAFPVEGKYTLQAIYRNEEEVLADASFELPVDKISGSVGRGINAATYVLAAALFVFAGYIIVRSFTRR